MKGAEEFLRLLTQGKGKKKNFEQMMGAHIHIFPEYKNESEQPQHLREIIDFLSNDEKIQLPSMNGKSWRAGNPSLPSWIMINLIESTTSIIPKAYAWHPKLAPFVDNLNLKQKEVAFKISEYLKHNTDKGKFEFLIPRRERSLKIFKDEKRLDSLSNKGHLLSNNLSLEELGCYDVNWPIPYKQPSTPCPNKAFLIIENHHTFASFCKWNETARHYSGIGYGAGEAFSSLENDSIEEIISLLNASEIKYFGDIDPKGISIPARVNQARIAKAMLPILPEIELYEWLLENGIKRSLLKGKQSSYLTGWLSESIEEKIKQLFAENIWFPQEALGYEELQFHY